MAGLFTGKEQYGNFNRIDTLFPTGHSRGLGSSGAARNPQAISLPAAFAFDGTDRIDRRFPRRDRYRRLACPEGRQDRPRELSSHGRTGRPLVIDVGRRAWYRACRPRDRGRRDQSVDEPVTAYLLTADRPMMA
ncbi:MAG: hypothetical protein IPG62_15690 [Sphingomonadales bacterium]|nr:hypothetical protein [Sphingomonadales bacterium]